MTPLAERSEYAHATLERKDLVEEPIEQLRQWWNEAVEAKVRSIDSMHLATVDANGHPDGRIVLLKSFDENGLVFYTNYQSQKGLQLHNNPYASMTLFWPELERQVRVRGAVRETSREESENYFTTRPRGAKLAAWASEQSHGLMSRGSLEEAYARMQEHFEHKEVPCPKHWGGYRLIPSSFEFWQGRPNRLHDRFCYRQVDGRWVIERLAP